MSVSMLLVLGLALAVNARDCLTPNAVENFDISKYEGVWYSVALDILNKTEGAKYEGDTCYAATFKTVEDQIECKFNYLKKGTPKEIVGRLTLAENTKGLLIVKSTNTPTVFNYPSYNVICTDYNNYAVVYVSKQFEDEKCSEMAAILSRDRTKFAELTSSDDVKKCIQDQLKASVDQFKQIVQSDC